MEVVIKKGGRYLVRKLIFKNIYIKKEVIRFENEIVIYEIVFGMVHG
jgi:hypothetical protein